MATQTRQPTGLGNGINHSANIGTVWEAVDDTIGVPDDDSTYAFLADANGQSYFSYTAFNVESDAILKLSITLRARHLTGNATSGRSVLRVNGFNYSIAAPSVNLSDTYQEITQDYLTNPDTGLSWAVDDINGVGSNPLQEFGFRNQNTSAGEEARFTQVYATAEFAGNSPELLKLNTASLTDTTTGQVTLTATRTGSILFFIPRINNSASPVASVVDDSGVNSWQLVEALFDVGGLAVELWVCLNNQVSQTLTITATFESQIGAGVIAAAEFFLPGQGVAAIIASDNNTAFDTITHPASAVGLDVVAPLQLGIAASVLNNTDGGVTPPTNWSLLEEQSTRGASFYFRSEAEQVFEDETAAWQSGNIRNSMSVMAVLGRNTGEATASAFSIGTVSGDLTTAIECAGTTTGTGIVAADLTTAIQCAAIASGLGTASSDLYTAIHLAASLDGTGTATASLQAGATDIDGAASAQSTANGALTTQITTAGTLAGTGHAAADLFTAIPLSGAIIGDGAAISALTTAIRLATAIQGATTVAADLNTQIQFVAALSADGSLSGSLTNPAADLDAAITAQGTVSADLGTAITCVGNLQGQTNASADLSTEIRLALQAIAQCAAEGSLDTQITCIGSIGVVSTTSAELTAAITMAAAVVGTGQLAANLLTEIRLASGIVGAATGSALLADAIDFVPVGFVSRDLIEAYISAGIPTAMAINADVVVEQPSGVVVGISLGGGASGQDDPGGSGE